MTRPLFTRPTHRTSLHERVRRTLRLPESRRGNLLSLLVTFGFALMLILALSWVVFKILILLGVITPDIQCDWSILLIAISKFGTAGLADIPPECKTTYVTIGITAPTQTLPTPDDGVRITTEDLSRYLPDARTAITQYARQRANPAYRDILRHFNDPDSEAQQYEWALNRVVANYMQNCWTKVWEGKLPLFDSWWNLVDWDFFGTSRPSTNEQAAKQFRDPALTIPGTDRSLLQVYGPPTFCIYCARLKFDPAVRQKIGKDRVDSLTAWMKATQARPGSTESVFEFLLDETQQVNQEATYVRSISYPYIISEPYAVEFARVNSFGADISQLSSDLRNYFSAVVSEPGEVNQDRINRLVLIPAKDSIYPFGRQASTNTPAVQCLQQIG